MRRQQWRHGVIGSFAVVEMCVFKAVKDPTKLKSEINVNKTALESQFSTLFRPSCFLSGCLVMMIMTMWKQHLVHCRKRRKKRNR